MKYPRLALSIRQPWAHWIFYAGKDVENRSWPTRFRGPVLIHAGKAVDEEERHQITSAMRTGGIVGMARIVDCVTAMKSEWFCGRYGFVLRDAQPLEFVPCRGKLGIFTPDLDPARLRPVQPVRSVMTETSGV